MPVWRRRSPATFCFSCAASCKLAQSWPPLLPRPCLPTPTCGKLLPLVPAPFAIRLNCWTCCWQESMPVWRRRPPVTFCFSCAASCKLAQFWPPLLPRPCLPLPTSGKCALLVPTPCANQWLYVFPVLFHTSCLFHDCYHRPHTCCSNIFRPIPATLNGRFLSMQRPCQWHDSIVVAAMH